MTRCLLFILRDFSFLSFILSSFVYVLCALMGEMCERRILSSCCIYVCVCVCLSICAYVAYIFFLVLFRTFTSSFLYLNPSFSFAMPILLPVWCAYVYVKIFLALGCMCVCSTYKIYLRQNAAQIYIHLMLHMERVNAGNDETRRPFVFFIIEMQLYFSSYLCHSIALSLHLPSTFS